MTKATEVVEAIEGSLEADDDAPLSVVHEAWQTGLELDVEDLKDISARVRWVRSRCRSFEVFQRAKALAMLDVFTEWDAREKAAEFYRMFPDEHRKPAEIRKQVVYDDTKARLEETRDRVYSVETLDEQIKEAAPDAFQRLHRVALRGKNGKEAVLAAREFTERAAPRQSSIDLGRSIVLPAAVGLQVAKALAVVSRKQLEGSVLDSD